MCAPSPKAFHRPLSPGDVRALAAKYAAPHHAPQPSLARPFDPEAVRRAAAKHGAAPKQPPQRDAQLSRAFAVRLAMRLLDDADLAPPCLDASPSQAEIAHRHGVTLASELYPDDGWRSPVCQKPGKTKRGKARVEVLAPFEQIACEVFVSELRLRPASPAIAQAVRTLAGRKDAARKVAGWLVRLRREWPAPAAGELPDNPAAVARFTPARRTELVAAARGFTKAERAALRVLFDALLDRRALRGAYRTLAARAEIEGG